jgi:quinol monooxygenase YgiN
MEREKVVEEMIDQVKELLHESVEDQALTDEEVLEEHSYEESFQKYLDEAYHVEDYEEEFNEDEVLLLNEDIQAAIAPTHQEENTMSYDPFEDLDDNMFHDPESEGAL